VSDEVGLGLASLYPIGLRSRDLLVRGSQAEAARAGDERVRVAVVPVGRERLAISSSKPG
jgi:hypothetical protein